MKHKLELEFYEISKQIVLENKSLLEWAEIESDDMFQTNLYEGGFDSTGMEFVFSVFIDNKEYWFQVSIEDMYKINDRLISEVEIEESDW
ncbi:MULTISPECIES: hypothetical protein [unclassified Paraflavitalea]|jgi:hypothetical protein|uniref:hypothetical protein n=1 Tax=unclassified Paraflavitalea TaxID=2798305 RepID=UPI003D349533